MDMFGTKYAALEQKHQALLQEHEETQQRLLSERRQLEWQKAESAKLAGQLAQLKTENGQLAARCQWLEQEATSLRALLPTPEKSVFLRFGDEKIRFDRIERFRVDEDGYVVEVGPVKVSFGFGETALRIRGSALEAAITALYQGPNDPPPEN